MSINRDVFEDLFVLEMANNHWGRLDRARKIVDDFSKIVKYNNVRASLKVQLRDVDSFVHKDYLSRTDNRYIKKTIDTKMSQDDFKELIQHIRKSGCIPTATPFDETSVDFTNELELPILKIASSDINDWVLIEKIATTRKPVIASTGGSSLKDMDDLVTFFENRKIPLALNHCVSLYPSEDDQLELNQIDFMKNRYPGITMGFSSHEYHDWESSMLIAYAKGARTFERHVDIDADGIPVSSYCTKPEQCDTWFKAFKKAQEMCGGPGIAKRHVSRSEIEYLDALVRGVYAKRDLPVGHAITDDDIYLAIPLTKAQLSCRELITGEVLSESVVAHQPITISDVDNPYSRVNELRDQIQQRGL